MKYTRSNVIYLYKNQSTIWIKTKTTKFEGIQKQTFESMKLIFRHNIESRSFLMILTLEPCYQYFSVDLHNFVKYKRTRLAVVCVTFTYNLQYKNTEKAK